MLRASWTSLWARKVRLFLSAFAVVLGVAFVAGSLIFTDTLGHALDGLMTGSVGDVVVRPSGVGGDDNQSARSVPGSLAASLAGVPGAARADGHIANFGTFVVSKQRKLIGGQGAPGIGVNHSTGPAAHGIAPATLKRGRWPTRAGEVVLDPTTAAKSGYLLGEQVPLVSSGAQPRISATLVGTAQYGSNGLVGASLAIFDTPTAQKLFMDGKNAYTEIWVTARSGTSQADLRAAVASRLPAGFEAVTGDSAAKQAASDIQKALGFISTFLLVFAGIALVVGSFLIVNTFSILVAQRSRELALLRALGAGRRQVGRSVILEAVVVGFVGSSAGLGLGFVLALAIKALFGRFGLDLSGAGLVFQPRTALAAYAVGMLVTLVAAYVPARRAGKVPPVAAMRDDVVIAEGSLRRRVVLGAVLVLAGGASMGLGLFGDVPKDIWWIGLGTLGVVLGVALTSPLVGRPVISLLGAIYRRAFGAVGLMAQQNAQRNPRRTAATASALMIGVTLVTMMTVFGASAKASVDRVIANEFAADYLVSNVIGVPFSPTIGTEVAKVPGVKEVARERFGPATVGGDQTYVVAADPASLDEITPLHVHRGTLTALRSTSVLVESGEATAKGITVGRSLRVELGGVTKSFTVAGLYDKNAMIGTKYLFSLGGFTGLGIRSADSYLYVTKDAGASSQSVQDGINAVIKDLPTVTLKDQAAFADEQRAPIDQLIYMIYALLGLAIVIAVLGIINTLALSVIERTREIGLLRAVGLSRKQLQGMLWLESVVIALLGAVLGVVLGTGFGVALQRALSDDGITELAIPWTNIVAFIGLAAAVGVLAALWPGRRAARLDMLRAITTE